MQGIYDYKEWFICIYICYLGTISDYLIFMQLDFQAKLETPRFLIPNFVVFSGNAHMSNYYIFTVYKGILSELKHTCNFYYL